MTTTTASEHEEKAPKRRPMELDTGMPTIGAASVAWLLGVSVETVRRQGNLADTPINRARIVGVGTVMRFRRADIDAMIEGPKASILPMRRGA